MEQTCWTFKCFKGFYKTKKPKMLNKRSKLAGSLSKCGNDQRILNKINLTRHSMATFSIWQFLILCVTVGTEKTLRFDHQEVKEVTKRSLKCTALNCRVKTSLNVWISDCERFQLLLPLIPRTSLCSLLTTCKICFPSLSETFGKQHEARNCCGTENQPVSEWPALTECNGNHEFSNDTDRESLYLMWITRVMDDTQSI